VSDGTRVGRHQDLPDFLSTPLTFCIAGRGKTRAIANKRDGAHWT
jgi:hypothetical protein